MTATTDITRPRTAVEAIVSGGFQVARLPFRGASGQTVFNAWRIVDRVRQNYSCDFAAGTLTRWGDPSEVLRISDLVPQPIVTTNHWLQQVCSAGFQLRESESPLHARYSLNHYWVLVRMAADD